MIWVNTMNWYHIDLLHKTHHAPVTYLTMHHFVAEMCTCVHISVKKWCIVGYFSNALWDLWYGSIAPSGSYFSAIFIRNSNISNEFEIVVCKISAISFRPQYVKATRVMSACDCNSTLQFLVITCSIFLCWYHMNVCFYGQYIVPVSKERCCPHFYVPIPKDQDGNDIPNETFENINETS